ncbi:flagellar export chaperone FliS [Moellerella wisconsensis]|uniref:Flagellar protein FliS n=3 Tax=Gammaproteobacteria TaxID=1236 RepID=A0A9Q8Q4K5_9GAMM|nr:flagellar protein FliS [Moellerella wisconsensis]KLN96302.1 hypothetical protein VK86_10720 [Moellerella wisconsensis]UNH31889.1 flagellar protein FliS [Moellerella wisconsensis]
MTNLSAQKLYQSVDNESQILHSSPQQIIHILLKTVISRIKQAKLFIQKQEIVKKGESFNKAIDLLQTIIYADIDFAALQREDAAYTSLYHTVIKQLMYAHLHNDVSILETVIDEMSTHLILRQSQEEIQ